MRLTVRTSVHLQPKSNPPAGVPVYRHQADIVSHHCLLQLVLDHAVCITVPWKGLHEHSTVFQLIVTTTAQMSFHSLTQPI